MAYSHMLGIVIYIILTLFAAIVYILMLICSFFVLVMGLTAFKVGLLKCSSITSKLFKVDV